MKKGSKRKIEIINKEFKSGITLISLVLTIIVLIILAGISINLVLGDNGIITKAREAKIQTQTATEEEKIKLYLLSNTINSTEETQIGKKLYDKTVENGSKWDIIILKENNTVYGTDWNFIEKGTHLENEGEIKNSWLINSKTGKMIKLEENSYVELSYSTSLGTTNGLIFNLDSSIIEDGDKDAIQKQLGENVELINFDWNETSGLTKNSFNLDGINDYIKIKYNEEEEKQTLAENGFTFEFYGILNGGTSYDVNNEVINYRYKGIFCYWNGNESIQADLRYGIKDANKFFWNAGYEKYLSDYSENSNAWWNIEYPEIEELSGKKVYITITLDCSKCNVIGEEEYYKDTLYINGKKIVEGNYNKKSWDGFVTKKLNSLNYFCIGRSSLGTNGQWHYSTMNAYALRLYNRALMEEEVTQNYEKSVAYHDILN